MTAYPLPAGSPSQTTPNREVPIVDIAQGLLIGYFTAEYLNTRARLGLVFFHMDKTWKILHITSEEAVFVLPSKQLDSIIQSNNLGHKKETGITIQEESIAPPVHATATPTIERIIVESFQNYIIIQATLNTRINTSLRLAFDAMLTEQDLIRGSYNDNTRILIQTPAKLRPEEIQSIGSDLFYISPSEFDRLLLEAIEARFPQIITKENRKLKESPIEKALKEKLRSRLAVGLSKTILKRLGGGEIKVTTHFSTLKPSSTAQEFIEEYNRFTAGEKEKIINENAIKLKRSIERENAEPLCLNCLSSQGSIRIADVADRPKCEHCGSRLLALPSVPAQTVIGLVLKKKSSKLSPAETAQLAGARRTADLVLSYGKRAIIALSVPGVGPQTASPILASMPATDNEFYFDLLKAKIHYLTTRELWDGKLKQMTTSTNRVRFNI